MESAEIIRTSKGKPCLVLNGYQHRQRKENSNLIYWVCLKSEKNKCKGMVKTNHQYAVLSKTDHSCQPNIAEIEVKKTMERCRKRVREETSVPVNQIFKEEMATIRDKGYDLVTETPVYANAKTTLCRERRKILEAVENPKTSSDNQFKADGISIPNGEIFPGLDFLTGDEFEDDGDWVENFIQAVQSRPPIYNTSLPEHSDRNLVSRLWHEVCQTMIPTWHDMTSNERSLKVKDLQSRWRNLRTCFRRELNKQKQDKSCPSSKRRRKYVYYDQLLFLLPTMEDLPANFECGAHNKRTDYSESEDGSQVIQTMDILEDDEVDLNPTPKASSSSLTTYTRNPKTKRTSPEIPVFNVSREKIEESIDEDKFFLLSLVPTFRKLSDAQKIDAKIEFLSTLKRLTEPTQETSFHVPQGHGTYPGYGLHHGLPEYYVSKKSPPKNFNYNEENYPSESSTPDSVPSEASKGSNFESDAPNQENTDLNINS